MKRLPLLVNVILFAALCMMLTYGVLQTIHPKLRNEVAPVFPESFEPGLGQWGAMFGQAAMVDNAPSNYQLKGVIVAPRAQESVAIILNEGKPTSAVRIGKEIAPNVILKEVHADHILVTEAGADRRIDLPALPLLPGVNIVTANQSPAVQ